MRQVSALTHERGHAPPQIVNREPWIPSIVAGLKQLHHRLQSDLCDVQCVIRKKTWHRQQKPLSNCLKKWLKFFFYFLLLLKADGIDLHLHNIWRTISWISLFLNAFIISHLTLAVLNTFINWIGTLFSYGWVALKGHGWFNQLMTDEFQYFREISSVDSSVCGAPSWLYTRSTTGSHSPQYMQFMTLNWHLSFFSSSLQWLRSFQPLAGNSFCNVCTVQCILK